MIARDIFLTTGYFNVEMGDSSDNLSKATRSTFSFCHQPQWQLADFRRLQWSSEGAYERSLAFGLFEDGMERIEAKWLRTRSEETASLVPSGKISKDLKALCSRNIQNVKLRFDFVEIG